VNVDAVATTTVYVVIGAAGRGFRPTDTHELEQRRHGAYVAPVDDEVLVSQLAVQAVPRVV